MVVDSASQAAVANASQALIEVRRNHLIFNRTNTAVACQVDLCALLFAKLLVFILDSIVLRSNASRKIALLRTPALLILLISETFIKRDRAANS